MDNTTFIGAPQVEDVAQYCSEIGMAIDVPAFMSWHNERGWRHGKKYIALDWKTAVRKWFCKDMNVPFEEFEQQVYGKQNEVSKRKAV